jgi:hypothetical protein
MLPLTARFASTPLGKIEVRDSGVTYVTGLRDASTISVETRLSYTGTFTRKLGGYLPFGTYSPSTLSTEKLRMRLNASRIASSERFLPNHLVLFSTAALIM